LLNDDHDFDQVVELLQAATQLIAAYGREDVRAVTYWCRRLEHWGAAMALTLDLRSRPEHVPLTIEQLKEGSN